MSKPHMTVNQQGIRLSVYPHTEPMPTQIFELPIMELGGWYDFTDEMLVRA